MNDVAYANFIDGFSFEGNSPGGSTFNCIGIENGLNNSGSNLWVDAASSVGFSSDHNIFWNSTLLGPVRYVATRYATLAEFTTATGHDAHSRQGDPLFSAPLAGNFALGLGSPAIDAAHSGVAHWPATDILGTAPVNDFRTIDTGEGSVTFADIGPFEYIPLDSPPVVTSPTMVKSLLLLPIVFNVTASDLDGDPITSLVMVQLKMPAGNGATFTPNDTNTGGTFSWLPGLARGNFRVAFIASNTQKDTSETHIQILAKVRSEAISQGLEGAAFTLAFSNGFPNPSAGVVDFSLELPEASDMDWSVYDTQGRRIWSEARSLPAGQHRLRWNGASSSGRRAETGVYFIRARVGATEFVRRVVRF